MFKKQTKIPKGVETVPLLDKDGYPTEVLLEKIRTWKECNDTSLFQFIRPAWKYAESGYWQESGEEFQISTGGWSGNESIIETMEANFIFWAMWWKSTERGGHYVFERI